MLGAAFRRSDARRTDGSLRGVALLPRASQNSGALVPDNRVRAPHVLSLAFPRNMPEKAAERLAAHNVYVAPRLGRMRLSPHVYNDETDVDRFVETFRAVLGPELG